MEETERPRTMSQTQEVVHFAHTHLVRAAVCVFGVTQNVFLAASSASHVTQEMLRQNAFLPKTHSAGCQSAAAP